MCRRMQSGLSPVHWLTAGLMLLFPEYQETIMTKIFATLGLLSTLAAAPAAAETVTINLTVTQDDRGNTSPMIGETGTAVLKYDETSLARDAAPPKLTLLAAVP